MIWVTWEVFVGGVMDRNCDVITFISKCFCFKKAYSSYLCHFFPSKLWPCLLKQSLRTQKNLTELQITYQNAIYFCISWYSKNRWFPLKKKLMSVKLMGCVMWFIYFLDLLRVRYNCAKFHHCKICLTDFKEEGDPL